MLEFWFYHLQVRPLERVLPDLLQKSLAKDWRVVVQARSEERLDALDQWLWTFSDESFLAHGCARDGDADMHPVYLSTGPENPNGASVRFFVEGADVMQALESGPYLRAVNLFDGNSEDELLHAREQWKILKAAGYSLTYWQQGESGRWEKKG